MSMLLTLLLAAPPVLWRYPTAGEAEPAALEAAVAPLAPRLPDHLPTTATRDAWLAAPSASGPLPGCFTDMGVCADLDRADLPTDGHPSFPARVVPARCVEVNGEVVIEDRLKSEGEWKLLAAPNGKFQLQHIKTDTYLGADGKIGTFVETKNSTIGAGSKVPHLSYIGDTTVGERSNVGAGTITANYDGVTKSATVVGSHVRTGSHNVFVGPVTIGDGAYTGAGTVVRKDVPSGALAINVAPQRNMEGWVAANRAGTAAAQAAEQAE